MYDVRIINDEAVLFENGIEKMNLEYIRENGTIQYNFSDGSSIYINSGNTIHWYDSDGNGHRDGDIPAYITIGGYLSYYKHGVWHRENGPAVIRSNGNVEYYLDDIEYTKKEFINELNSNYGCIYHV